MDSRKCASAGLDKNDYDRSKCVDYFERYKSCKKWEVSFSRQGIDNVVILNQNCVGLQVETRAERRKLKDQADSKKK